MTTRIIVGDALDVLRSLPDGSHQACVTSPPYFGLRDYGVEGQIGLEEDPAAYIARLVEVFREVRRVLRDDGTLWLNMGDSYAGSWGSQGRQGEGGAMATRSVKQAQSIAAHPRKQSRTGSTLHMAGIKPKDLLLMPERLLMALQADGWWVRDKIVWHKPNPMPSSVRDRFCPAWEPVFLLSKSARYYFDREAARESRVQDEDANGFRGGSYTNNEPGPRQSKGNKRIKVPGAWDVEPGAHGTTHRDGRTSATYRARSGNKRRVLGVEVGSPSAPTMGRGVPWEDTDGKRLMRNVWTIATEPFKDAHFATFPRSLAERCVLIGSPPGAAILDPFGGAGTTGLVALELQRSATLIELNPEYAALARRRIGLFAEVA